MLPASFHRTGALTEMTFVPHLSEREDRSDSGPWCPCLFCWPFPPPSLCPPSLAVNPSGRLPSRLAAAAEIAPNASLHLQLWPPSSDCGGMICSHYFYYLLESCYPQKKGTQSLARLTAVRALSFYTADGVQAVSCALSYLLVWHTCALYSVFPICLERWAHFITVCPGVLPLCQGRLLYLSITAHLRMPCFLLLGLNPVPTFTNFRKTPGNNGDHENERLLSVDPVPGAVLSYVYQFVEFSQGPH